MHKCKCAPSPHTAVLSKAQARVLTQGLTKLSGRKTSLFVLHVHLGCDVVKIHQEGAWSHQLLMRHMLTQHVTVCGETLSSHHLITRSAFWCPVQRRPYDMFSGNTEVGFSEFPVIFIIRNTVQDGVKGRIGVASPIWLPCISTISNSCMSHFIKPT